MALVEFIKNCTKLAQYTEPGIDERDIVQNETNTTHINDSIPCDGSQQSILTKYSFATEGIGLFTVAVVGIVANLLSIAVLSEKTMKSQITALLITLAVFDTLFLLCCIPVFSISSFRGFVDYLNTCVYKDGHQIEFMSADMQDYYFYCLPSVYALTHVAKVGSVFTTLAVSLERYFAVCKPLWIHIRRCHPANYIVSVVVFAVGFNIPKFMEFEIHTLENNRTTIYPTSLRTNEHYVVYYNFVFKTLLTELFPYCSLIFLNFCIYREIRRSIKLQQSMRCTHSQKEEIKSANVVVGVVLLSILCHIWKIVPDLYEAIDTLFTQQQVSGNEGGVTPLSLLNSTEEQQHVSDLSKVNISEEMNYHLSVNNSLYETTYGPSYSSLSASSPYFEELTRNDTLETILMIPDGVYPSISNCSDVLKRLSDHYNLTGEALLNALSSSEDVNEESDGEPQHVQSYNIEFIIDTSHLLVGINSAANFFLYLILRKNFRAATWRILSCKPQVIRSPRTQFSTYHQTATRNTLRISQEINSTKPSQAHRLERQTTNAKIMSNANICENRNVNQDDSIHFNLKKKYDKERNAPNHAKQERNRQIADNPNIGILGDLEEQMDEESPLHHPTMKQNGTAGVRFSDHQSNYQNNSSIPDLNYSSVVNSKTTNDIHIDVKHRAPSKAKNMSTNSNVKEAQPPSSKASYHDEKMIEPLISSNKEVSINSKVHSEDKNRHQKETLQSPDNLKYEFQGNESLSDNNSIDDLLITSVLDTSPVTSSSCLDPSSASTKSSTFTVLSANKIYENRCSIDDQRKKEIKSTSGCIENGKTRCKTKRNQICKCALKDARKLNPDIELKSLISPRQPKVRIRSYSQDLSFPSLSNDINKDEQIDVVCGQSHELKALQGLSAVKTVVINL